MGDPRVSGPLPGCLRESCQGGAWGRHLALSRSAQVVREVPALGKDLAAAWAHHLMVAESLAMEAAWDCFLEVRMWLK